MTTCVMTGANSGVGLEACRQLAMTEEVGKIILTCRSAEKAEKAIETLVEKTGKDKSLFDYVILDLNDLASVKAAVKALPKVDRLCMNGGGAYKGMHESGVTNTFAPTLGHAVLCKGLLADGKLSAGAHVLYVSSEAIRSVWAFTGFIPGFWGHYSESYIEDSISSESWGLLPVRGQLFTYAKGKLVGTLYFQHMAKAYPEIHWIVTSPGGTPTGFADGVAQPIPFLIANAQPVFMAMGALHSLEEAAKRYADLMTGDAPKFPSGSVPMSPRNRVGCLWGPVGELDDNAQYEAYLRDPALQKKAGDAVEKWMDKWEAIYKEPAATGAASTQELM